MSFFTKATLAQTALTLIIDIVPFQRIPEIGEFRVPINQQTFGARLCQRTRKPACFCSVKGFKVRHGKSNDVPTAECSAVELSRNQASHFFNLIRPFIPMLVQAAYETVGIGAVDI